MWLIDHVMLLPFDADHKETHRYVMSTIVLAEFYCLELRWNHFVLEVAKLPGGMAELLAQLVHAVSVIRPVGLCGCDNGHVVSLDHLNEIVVPDVARVAPQAACIVEGEGCYFTALNHAVQVLLALPVDLLAAFAIIHGYFANVGEAFRPQSLLCGFVLLVLGLDGRVFSFYLTHRRSTDIHRHRLINR